MSEQRRIGAFKVRGRSDFKTLEAVQRGCAILRCEYLAYADMFDIVAEHPDFEPIPPGLMPPEYDVEMTTDLNSDPIRKRFVRIGL